jgi:ketosteroid isomerase-like protein
VDEMSRRLLDAMNVHDLDAFTDCFAPDYRSEQPAHPNRAFRGADQARRNWEGVFAGVPDFSAELLALAVADGGVELAEWRWSGTHTDGSAFTMRGATVFGVEDGRLAWGRLYMEPVEQAGSDIDEMVQETYRPPSDRER